MEEYVRINHKFKTFRLQLLGIGLMLFLFGAAEIFKRAVIDVNAKVVSADTSCIQPQNNRCFTHYLLRDLKGNISEYTAGPNDHSLRRRLPIATSIVKRRWSLNYLINDHEIRDFPSFAYGCFALLGGCSIFSAFWLQRKQR